jgi:serine/threonine-protein kinase
MRRPSTSFSLNADSLPAGMLREATDRMAVLALVYAVVYFVSAFLIPAPPEFAEHAGRLWVRLANGAFITLALVFFAALRAGWVGPTHLLVSGFVFEFVGAVGIEWGLLHWEFLDASTLSLPWTAWTPVWIVVFPLIAPSSPWKAFGAATAAASVRPAMLGIIALQGATLPPAGNIVPFVAVPYVCVAIALVSAKVVYGLGRDVAKARRMGSYRLTEKLGEGGMGEVWKAQHRLLAREAAIKLIRSKETDGRLGVTRLRRFEREVQATANLRSPHTIEVYDYGHASDGTFYYVMELLDGLDLSHLVKAHGALRPGRVIHILRQVCHSLGEAHEQGLVHRDIKPANIFLCRQGRDVDVVKVLDFGLVKGEQVEASDQHLTLEGSFYGTPAYASPEAAQGQLDRIDGRSDLYSLGCVAYWLLTGRPVFEAATPMEILVQHTRAMPDPPSRHLEDGFPEDLDRVILDLLEKDQSGRIGSADELDARLRELQATIPWPEAEATRWWQRHRPASRPCSASTRGRYHTSTSRSRSSRLAGIHLHSRSPRRPRR